jgi:hypothetical protein
MEIIKAVALLVWPTFLSLTLFLFKLANLNIADKSMSDLGVHVKYGKLFNILLFICGSFQLIVFIAYILVNEPTSTGLVGLGLLIFTTFCGILTSVLNQKNYSILHKAIATMGFLMSAPGWAIFGASLGEQNIIGAILMISWGATVIPFAVYRTLVKNQTSLLTESLLFTGAFFTNLILFNYI